MPPPPPPATIKTRKPVIPVGRFQVYVVVVVGANRITHSAPIRVIETLEELLIS